jgi:hypothetical protein
MTISDSIVVIAILLGPILAIQIQQRLDRLREVRRMKEEVFRVLMATRGNRRAPEHMQALNSIDVAFYGGRRSDVRVSLASKAYLLSLTTDGDKGVSSLRTQELFGELLTSMASNLGFELSRVSLMTSPNRLAKENSGLFW